ncbi:hypothetical protein [Cohnella lubricantis]|uniref:Uncharacterized protein n=1 Tax=Cohnella lubricantis TaxID=2163172 RepID=A0A841TF82_9BACL|nr:hypothetical protein [Cohnella lubricantis]MBB6678966.1 hypothetical protein [Cohnella lubricantis]MBP2118814.1 hypothetical protein [Cohnella lubricantis]
MTALIETSGFTGELGLAGAAGLVEPFGFAGLLGLAGAVGSIEADGEGDGNAESEGAGVTAADGVADGLAEGAASSPRQPESAIANANITAVANGIDLFFNACGLNKAYTTFFPS